MLSVIPQLKKCYLKTERIQNHLKIFFPSPSHLLDVPLQEKYFISTKRKITLKGEKNNKKKT